MSASLALSQSKITNLTDSIENAWSQISITWPLKNFVASAPFSNLTYLPFTTILKDYLLAPSHTFSEWEVVNNITMTWCQAYFDTKQAVITMPNRDLGLWCAWHKLALRDPHIKPYLTPETKSWLKGLSPNANEVIEACLKKIEQDNVYDIICSNTLQSLPGWSGYVAYLCDHTCDDFPYPVRKSDYLALRLVLALLCNVDVKKNLPKFTPLIAFKDIDNEEKKYQNALFETLGSSKLISKQSKSAEAQFIFCIDVRSEPLRRVLENNPRFETYGFAGFFGLLTTIHDTQQATEHASCPVIVKPRYTIDVTRPTHWFENVSYLLKKIYRDQKMSLVTPYTLIDFAGPIYLVKTVYNFVKTLFPEKKGSIPNDNLVSDSISNIPLEDQVNILKSAFLTMGLKHFSPYVIVCGHGGESVNNAHKDSLHCGACGGHHGLTNAQAFANIANDRQVRHALKKHGIRIPEDTVFIAGYHNTTQHSLSLCSEESIGKKIIEQIKQCENDYREFIAKREGCRLKALNQNYRNWSQAQPEWALSRNAAFIIGTRNISKNSDLDARCFLHSYTFEDDDAEAHNLTSILMGPMMVTWWINSHYFFTCYAPETFSSGDKALQNIVGGRLNMIGYKSDLGRGLSQQSLMRSHKVSHHQPLRLSVIIEAPANFILKIISKNQKLRQLVDNEWLFIFSFYKGQYNKIKL